MASKKGNGHDPLTLRMVEVLERIEAESKATNERLGRIETAQQGTNARLDQIAADLADFKDETREELTAILGQLQGDKSGTVQAQLTRLDERVRKLEKKAG